MSTEHPHEHSTEHGHDHGPDRFAVKVTVNGKPVTLREHRLTGLQIKQAAIDQHVAIELSFILQEELPNGHNKIVGDNDTITVHDHDRFTAIPNDDNS
jgi:hypothetical protein